MRILWVIIAAVLGTMMGWFFVMLPFKMAAWVFAARPWDSGATIVYAVFLLGTAGILIASQVAIVWLWRKELWGKLTA